jgi:hypothetical protein
MRGKTDGIERTEGSVQPSAEVKRIERSDHVRDYSKLIEKGKRCRTLVEAGIEIVSV